MIENGEGQVMTLYDSPFSLFLLFFPLSFPFLFFLVVHTLFLPIFVSCRILPSPYILVTHLVLGGKKEEKRRGGEESKGPTKSATEQDRQQE